MTQMPEDPMNMADEGWVAVHELFLGLRRGGFTVQEAAAVIAAMFRPAPQ